MKAKLCSVALQAEAGGTANPMAAGQPVGRRIRKRCLEAGKARIVNSSSCQLPCSLGSP